MSASLSINPAEALSVGFTLQVIRARFDPPKQCTATVIRHQPGELLAEVQDLAPRTEQAVNPGEPDATDADPVPEAPPAPAPAEWAAGERVLFIAHLPDGRYLGSATVIREQGNRLTFSTEDAKGPDVLSRYTLYANYYGRR